MLRLLGHLICNAGQYLLERGQCKGLPLHCAKKTFVVAVVVVVVVFVVVVEVVWALNM